MAVRAACRDVCRSKYEQLAKFREILDAIEHSKHLNGLEQEANEDGDSDSLDGLLTDHPSKTMPGLPLPISVSVIHILTWEEQERGTEEEDKNCWSQDGEKAREERKLQEEAIAQYK